MQNDDSHQYDHSGVNNESLPSWSEYFIGATKVAALTLLFHGCVIVTFVCEKPLDNTYL